MQPYTFQEQWSSLRQAPDEVTQWDTGVDLDTLRYVGAKSVALPEDFVSWFDHNVISGVDLDTLRYVGAKSVALPEDFVSLIIT